MTAQGKIDHALLVEVEISNKDHPSKNNVDRPKWNVDIK
jgi:hypothetical protein